jgi:hypothetical protein
LEVGKEPNSRKKSVMEQGTQPDTAAPIPPARKRNWVWPVVGLVVILIAAAGIGWFGIRDAGSNAADDIHGTWYWSRFGAYTNLEVDGEWSVGGTPEGAAYDWGIYTFEDGVLTFFNADDSYCPGDVAVWEGAFSEDGDELQLTFVSDTCTGSTVVRDQDMVLVRYTPDGGILQFYED